MHTGHTGLINKKRKVFLKRSNGYVIPTNLFLSINHLDLKSMILLIEQLKKEEIAEIWDYDEDNYGTILADQNLRIYELSKSCIGISQLSIGLLSLFNETYGRSPTIEDLFSNMA